MAILYVYPVFSWDFTGSRGRDALSFRFLGLLQFCPFYCAFGFPKMIRLHILFVPAKSVGLLLASQRAWELLAGGIVALQFRNSEQKYSSILLASGFFAHSHIVVFLDKNLPWPSYWALLPVTGTCLVIAANRADASPFKTRSFKPLENGPIRFISGIGQSRSRRFTSISQGRHLSKSRAKLDSRGDHRLGRFSPVVSEKGFDREIGVRKGA